MASLRSFIRGAALGVTAMYLMDPDRGRRRRALIRDQFVAGWHDLNNGIARSARDLGNRGRGLVAEALGRVRGGAAPDWVIEERVRSRLGRACSHPRALQVSVEDGVVTLAGPVLAHELERVLWETGSVRGVAGVENQLELHEHAAGIPALQGEFAPPRAREGEWPPALRAAAVAGGALLVLKGLRRRGALGAVIGLGGAALAVRGLTNLDSRRMLGARRPARGPSVQKTIHIDAPPDVVYQFWSRFENFPRFMPHVRAVQDLGNGRSRWEVVGPAGAPLEWEAEVTRQEPNRRISWRTLGDPSVGHEGTVRFDADRRGGTRVHVRMTYAPPAGAVGAAVARAVGPDPRQALDEGLLRLKSLLEIGKTTTEGQEVRRDELRRNAEWH
ncbi:MAG: SRPBCC family protein [Acidobacteria bacterium]|nr:SRPBCC family protein [Acidobacteriota bacterium]